jgi:hypothetical protein
LNLYSLTYEVNKISLLMKKIILILVATFIVAGVMAQNKKGALEKMKIRLTAQIQYYNGNKVAEVSEFNFEGSQSFIQKNDATWNCDMIKNNSPNDFTDLSYTFQITSGTTQSAGVAINFLFDEWSPDNYIILPAAVYNGNRFDVLKYKYPPLFKKEEYKVIMPITITDVPRLNKYKGESRIDLNTGDLTTPSIGIYFPKTKKGIWILTEQATELGNSSLSLTESDDRTKAEFKISAPCIREKIYSMAKLTESNETGVKWKHGDIATIRFKIFIFENVNSPAELNNHFPAIRKTYGTTTYVNQLPFSKGFEIMENQQNQECWDEKNSYYTLGGDGWNTKWQLGWVGGCMVTYPLSLIGQPISQERSFQNYDKIITQSQAESGFYYSCSNGIDWCSDCFYEPHPDNLLLLRKNSDALYYFYKYCLAQKAINPGWQMPEAWKEPLKKFTGAFVTLWKRYGQFGQHIDIKTGEIRIGGTNSAVMAIGGLALASQFEKRADLLKVAKEAGMYYYENFIRKGISCGGPGEILQNNDAESAFAMLESLVVLYEVTGEKIWLKFAEDAAALSATWMVSYDYRFPENSLFGELDIRTSGAVWANVQNKHGGPGICTASGDCLLKLYRATGNKLYIQMLNDVAHNLMQYISREDRPISKQLPGWINERVNLSDWEGKKQIGGIFYGNTWAQVSAMLTVAEIPGIYVNMSKKEIYVFDHVEATLEENRIKITNSTKFDARIRIFIDKDLSKSYTQGFMSLCKQILVKAGTSEYYIM